MDITYSRSDVVLLLDCQSALEKGNMEGFPAEKMIKIFVPRAVPSLPKDVGD